MGVVAGIAAIVESAAGRRASLVLFDPLAAEAVSGEEAAALAEELATTEKACAAARGRAAARAAACGTHVQRGYADPADWLARAAGSTRGDAQAAMGVAAAYGPATPVGAGLAAGDLSLAQARVIAECPGAEAELVAVARRASLAKLHDEALHRRLATIDPEALHRRQYRAREFRHWRDIEGMVRLAGALPPAVGVALMNRLDCETERVRRAATGDPEPWAADAADALVAMLHGGGVGGGAGKRRLATDLVVVCDLAAYRRGHAHAGEPCHLVGGGPVPVAVARRLAGDAFVKAVIHDGVRIESVVHFGRHLPAELRTALELGPPPHFDGIECADDGCDRRYGLEWDHVDPVANGGATSFANLRARCGPHHRAKTERDRRAGLPGVPP